MQNTVVKSYLNFQKLREEVIKKKAGSSYSTVENESKVERRTISRIVNNNIQNTETMDFTTVVKLSIWLKIDVRKFINY